LKEVEEVPAKIGVLRRDPEELGVEVKVNVSIESPLRDLEEAESE